MRRLVLIVLCALAVAAPDGARTDLSAALHDDASRRARNERADGGGRLGLGIFSAAAQGMLSALSTASITVTTDGGNVTCSLGSASPALGDFHVGDSVRLYCINGVVYQIRSNTTATTPPPPPTTPKYTGRLGTIASLSVDRITVSTDGGLVSCYVGTSSSSTSDFHVGDRAKIYCADGVLIALVRP
jgi:hypothetical protein